MKKFIPPLCLIMFLCAWTPIRNPTTPTDVQTDFNSIYDELHTKYQTKYVINVKDYGAKGDSITDDTAVIQAALNTGQSIFIPPTNNYYKINGTLYLTANGQTVSGVGPLSKIVQTGNDPTTASVFIASSVSNVRFENLYVIPGSSVSLITQGFAFYLYNSSNSSVNNCLVTGHRRGGIGLVSCSYCQIKGNTIRDSIVNPATDNHIQSGSDINIFYQSSNNIVMGNTIVNGCGIGISVQTINPGDTAIDNVISGNSVSNEGIYGIMVYKNNSTDNFTRNLIVGNNVDTVTGNIQQASYGYVYGTGIYVQGAEYTIVSYNNIYNTNTNPNIYLQLAPGGIGATNVTNVTITGNSIQKSNAWAGINVGDPAGIGFSTGSANVTGNSISSGTYGILVYERGRVNIVGNDIDNVISNGIAVQNPASNYIRSIKIESNNIRNVLSGSGVSVIKSSQTSISMNSVYNVNAYGVYVSSCSNYLIQGNILDTGVIGIGNDVGNSYGFIGGNNISNMSYGVLMNSVATTRRNNFLNIGVANLSLTAGYDDYVSPNFPTTGTWNKGNTVWNDFSVNITSAGWVCTVSGTPGTWHPIAVTP